MRAAADSTDKEKKRHPHPVHALLVTGREVPQDNPHHERRRQQKYKRALGHGHSMVAKRKEYAKEKRQKKYPWQPKVLVGIPQVRNRIEPGIFHHALVIRCIPAKILLYSIADVH